MRCCWRQHSCALTTLSFARGHQVLAPDLGDEDYRMRARAGAHCSIALHSTIEACISATAQPLDIHQCAPSASRLSLPEHGLPERRELFARPVLPSRDQSKAAPWHRGSPNRVPSCGAWPPPVAGRASVPTGSRGSCLFAGAMAADATHSRRRLARRASPILAKRCAPCGRSDHIPDRTSWFPMTDPRACFAR